jgi:UDP-N-acetylmuramoylalanine--D-glutamate ligase
MGLGAFGGGAGAARFLAARGARVTITDLKPEQELQPSMQRLSGVAGIDFRLGRHEPVDFTSADLLVVNPAIPRNSPYLRLAAAAGIPLTSEMNLFWLHHRGRVVGVTGSNGKSTTSALTHSLLRSGGVPCRLGGNIGLSLLPDVDGICPDEWVVLELSSFQLADLDHLQRSPAVAIVTNFTPNHLDRHASLDEYRAAKQTILRWQASDGLAILNGDDADVAMWPASGRWAFYGTADTERVAARVTADHVAASFDGRRCDVDLGDHVALPGRHNALNVAAATLAALACGVDPGSIASGVRTFRGLPHRLQFVAEVGRRRFYNDSKATTPDAALAALAAFAPHQRVILLAGGSDKGIDLTPYAVTIARRCAAVALLGETAATLEAVIRGCAPTSPPLLRAPSLTAAFAWAVEQSRPGDVVLLSPGCASYDWFANYEDRGDQFMALVHERPTDRPVRNKAVDCNDGLH